MKTIVSVLLVLAGAVSTPAYAWNASFQARVTMIEPSYTPSDVVFAVDQGVAGCNAGSLLSWKPRGSTADEKIANSQAILSMLQTAKATGGTIDIFVNTSNCSVEFLHFL